MDNKTVGKIIEACGYNPLAITTVCSTIRYGLVDIFTLLENLNPNTRVGNAREVSSISNCLLQSYMTLHDELKKKFLQLSLFKTAHFDLKAAAVVLGEKEIKINSGQFSSTSNDLLSLKSRHLVEIQQLDKSIGKSRYSLHPLVFHFLKDLRLNEAERNDLLVAKDKFIKHFIEVVCKIGEQIDSNTMSAQREISKEKVHVLNFYDELLEAHGQVVTLRMQDVHQCRRISELADFIVDEDKIWRMIQTWIKQAEVDGNNTGYIFWKCVEGNKLICLNRNEFVKDSLDDIEMKMKLFNLIPEQMEMFADQAAVAGQYFFLKGRYLSAENQYREAIVELEQCIKFFRKMETFNNQNILKHEYWNLHAIAYNSIGCCYFELGGKANVEKAKRCYMHAIKKSSGKSYKNMNVEIPNYLCNLAICEVKEGSMLREEGKEDEGCRKIKDAIKFFDDAVQKEYQMNIHKMDVYARTVLARGEAKEALQYYDQAVEDMREAMMLRRRILPPPHENITIATHKLGRLLYRKGIWLYHENKHS